MGWRSQSGFSELGGSCGDAWSEERTTCRTTAEPVALAVSVDDFSALEERIRRAVDLVKRERQARAAAEERAAATRRSADAHASCQLLEQLQNEIELALRAERDQVRQRVERLLAQLDALEL